MKMTKKERDEVEQLSMTLFGTKSGWRKLREYKEVVDGEQPFKKVVRRDVGEIIKTMNTIIDNLYKQYSEEGNKGEVLDAQYSTIELEEPSNAKDNENAPNS